MNVKNTVKKFSQFNKKEKQTTQLVLGKVSRITLGWKGEAYEKPFTRAWPKTYK